MSYYNVPSKSTAGVIYTVYVPETDDELATCECWKYKRSRGPMKTCHHIQDIIKQRMAARSPTVQNVNTSHDESTPFS